VTKEVAAAAVAYPMGVQVDTAAAAEAVARARDRVVGAAVPCRVVAEAVTGAVADGLVLGETAMVATAAGGSAQGERAMGSAAGA
jgi:hypothetical protein